MSTPKARAVQVPGAQPVAVEQEAQASEVIEPNAEAEVDEEVAALRAELAATKAKLAEKEAAVVAAPDQSARLTAGGAQQTAQGWLVPETFGAPAVKKA